MITTDAKAQQVIDAVTAWRSANEKVTSGIDNDIIVAPLTTASSEYIASVIRTTSLQAAAAPQQRAPGAMRMMAAQVDGPVQSLVQASPANHFMESYISGFY